MTYYFFCYISKGSLVDFYNDSLICTNDELVSPRWTKQKKSKSTTKNDFNPSIIPSLHEPIWKKVIHFNPSLSSQVIDINFILVFWPCNCKQREACVVLSVHLPVALTIQFDDVRIEESIFCCKCIHCYFCLFRINISLEWWCRRYLWYLPL